MRPTVRRILTTVTAISLLGFGAPAAAAWAVPEAAVRAVPGAEVVPDSYVVVLKPGAAAGAGQARTLAGRHAATLTATWSHALHGFAATMTATQARRMAAEPGVAYVQPNL